SVQGRPPRQLRGDDRSHLLSHGSADQPITREESPMRKDFYLARLAEVPMFQACSKRDLTIIGRRAEPLTFEPGQVLVREGTRGREVFVLVDGKATVTRGGVDVAELGPGDYFGELAVLDPGPRDATVAATTRGEAVIID